MKNIIGLIGYAGVGKDTLADQLVEEGWAKVSFSDMMKDLYLVATRGYPIGSPGFDKSREILEVRKRTSPDIRVALQNFGMAVREIDPNFWLRALEYRVWCLYADFSETGVVITDIRFENELELVKRCWAAPVFRLSRPGASPVNDHVSEHLAAQEDLPGVTDLVNHGGPEKWREVLELAAGI